MRRYVCPNCGSGKLAPAHARRDDVRVYCLLCSERTGRLVRRVCEAAQREASDREARKAARKVREAVARREALARREGRRQVRRSWEQPLRDLHRDWKRLRSWGRRLTCGLTIKRTDRGSRGWAHLLRDTIVVYVDTPESDSLEARVTLLHELAHIAAPLDAHHGREWRELYLAAAAEVLGVESIPVPPGRGSKFVLDEAVRTAMRGLAGPSWS
jgi:hypothetical protein